MLKITAAFYTLVSILQLIHLASSNRHEPLKALRLPAAAARSGEVDRRKLTNEIDAQVYMHVSLHWVTFCGKVFGVRVVHKYYVYLLDRNMHTCVGQLTASQSVSGVDRQR
jgi:hypothetical protein